MFIISAPNLKKIFESYALKLVSLVIIFWSVIIIVNCLLSLINATISDKMYDLSLLILLQQKITSLHGSILMAALLIGIQAIIWKKIKLWNMAITILLSFLLPLYQFMDNIIHPFLFSIHIYDLLLRPGQTILNPQFTKILLFCIVIFILFIQCLHVKYRAVDRIFILLIISVVLTTTAVFHFAIPMGMFKVAKKELENSLVEKIIFQPTKLLCEDKNCFQVGNNLTLVSQGANANITVWNQYKFILPAAASVISKNHNRFYATSLGNFQEQNFDYALVVIEKNDAGFFVVIDTEAAKKISRHSEIWFAFLSVIAHTVWLYGGLMLLFIHKAIIFKKLGSNNIG